MDGTSRAFRPEECSLDTLGALLKWGIPGVQRQIIDWCLRDVAKDDPLRPTTEGEVRHIMTWPSVFSVLCPPELTDDQLRKFVRFTTETDPAELSPCGKKVIEPFIRHAALARPQRVAELKEEYRHRALQLQQRRSRSANAAAASTAKHACTQQPTQQNA
jgi:hypothetical protein